MGLSGLPGGLRVPQGPQGRIPAFGAAYNDPSRFCERRVLSVRIQYQGARLPGDQGAGRVIPDMEGAMPSSAEPIHLAEAK